MDEKTLEYMKTRVEHGEDLKEWIGKLENAINIIEKEDASVCRISVRFDDNRRSVDLVELYPPKDANCQELMSEIRDSLKKVFANRLSELEEDFRKL